MKERKRRMQTRWSWLRTGLSALLLTGLSSSVLLAQNVTATITGSVIDSQGAVLKGAAVAAVNQKTGVEFRNSTNDAGVYTITGVQSGTYIVRAELTGFKAVVTNPITVETGQTARVDLKLDVGVQTETVEVVGVNPILQTENAV